MDLDLDELEATRNKSADKMFEELGYCKVIDETHIYYNHLKNDYVIEFDLFLEEVKSYLDDDCDIALGLTIQELKAINKKVEELRMVEKCEYCKEDFDGYFKTLDKNGHVCVFDMAHEKTLNINWYGKKMKIPINFCPMCGRKLV